MQHNLCGCTAATLCAILQRVMKLLWSNSLISLGKGMLEGTALACRKSKEELLNKGSTF